MPCMSEGNAPCAGVHPASRWRSRAAAARAHWNLRWAVGTTTIRRAGVRTRDRRAAVRARVVLPAPGCGHGQEVGLGGALQLLEGGQLPRPEPDGPGHSAGDGPVGASRAGGTGPGGWMWGVGGHGWVLGRRVRRRSA